MPFETDERLKSFLDTNQLQRELMCTAILKNDKWYSSVRTVHPRGGPDEGKDIEAFYRGTEKARGAVGFVNTANDSAQHKRLAQNKFKWVWPLRVRDKEGFRAQASLAA